MLQGKFAGYLSWSQPFLHDLLVGLDAEFRNVVVCNHTQNLERFPRPCLVRVPTRRLGHSLGALRVAAHLQRRFDPAVLHAHFGWSGVRMILLRQYLRRPLVVTFGGRDLAVQRHLPSFGPLYRVLLEMADHIVCVSHPLRDEVLRAGVEPGRVEVVHRGADLARFAFVDRRGRTSRELEVLMVGRLVEKKGHALALRALRLLRDQGSGVRLRIVGDGPEAEALRHLAGELGVAGSVEFAGILDSARVCQAMARADVLLQCSVTAADGDAEGLPNVIVEAAATGLAVVATDHGGIAEAVRPETGLLVAAEPAAVAAALARLEQAPEQRLALGRAGHELMRAEFDLRSQVARHARIYRELAQSHRPDHPRLRRNFLDPRILEALHSALEGEIWVTELIAEAFHGHLREGAEPGWSDRPLGTFRALPETWKAVLKPLPLWILTRYLEPSFRSRAEMDAAVLRYLAAGGSAAGIDPAWNLRRLSRHVAAAR